VIEGLAPGCGIVFLCSVVLGWGKNPTGLSVTFHTTENNKNEILFTHKIEILCHGKTC
jgi:hypothetical protein